MAKRNGVLSLDKLVSQLSRLDKQRAVLIDKLKRAVSAWSGAPWQPKGSSRATSVRRRRKMSKAARKKISAAQKKRWANQKAGATK